MEWIDSSGAEGFLAGVSGGGAPEVCTELNEMKYSEEKKMKCKNCGNDVDIGEVFCQKCGTAIQIVPDYNPLDFEIEVPLE